jgi:NAD(P)-dependent dehydrogenase (short-subunit alcohol dehydrogenase family)
VIATVRDPAALDDLAAAHGSKLQVETLDTTDWAGIDALRERLTGRTLDLLLVNAGISLNPRALIGEVDPDDFSRLMLINALAPLRIADRLADLVPAAGTIAVMSSGLGSVSRNETGVWEPYRMSKAALNMGLRSLAVRRALEGRTYIAISPGWVQTDMGGASAPLTIDQSIPKVADMLERRAGKGGVAFVSHMDEDVPW